MGFSRFFCVYLPGFLRVFLAALVGTSLLGGCSKRDTHTPITEQPPTIKLAPIVDQQRFHTTYLAHVTTETNSLITGTDGSILLHNQAEGYWRALPTAGLTSSIFAIAATDDGQQMMAVGEDGLIIMSNNAGIDWEQLAAPTTAHLRTLVFDPLRQAWWIGGDQGTLLKTPRDLSRWQAESWPQGKSITQLSYHPAQQRLTASGDEGLIALLNTDSHFWQQQNIPASTRITQHAVNDQNTTIALTAEGNVLRKNAGSISSAWQMVTLSPNTYLSGSVYDAFHHTWIVFDSEGHIYLSDDQGEHWAAVAGVDTYLNRGIYLAHIHRLLLVGDRGLVALSDDGGHTWSQQWLSDQAIEGIVALSPQTLLAYGNKGLLLESLDAGKHWHLLQTPIDPFIHEVIAINPDKQRWLAVGAKGLMLVSDDQGKSWQRQESATHQDDYLFTVIQEPTTHTLLSAGPPGTLLRSTDAGHHWERQLNLDNAGEGYFHQLLSNRRGTLVALAGPGKTLYSEDDGLNWQAAQITGEQHLYAGVYVDKAEVFIAAGQSGTIQRSHDGKVWEAITSNAGQDLYSLLADGNHIWIGGNRGTLLHSIDAGQHWTLVDTGTTKTLQYLTQTPKGSLIATGSQGLVLISRDAGKHWQHIEPPTATNLRRIYHRPNGDLWVASRAGEIFRSQDDGQHWQALPALTSASIKGLLIDESSQTLIGYGEALVRIPLP